MTLLKLNNDTIYSYQYNKRIASFGFRFNDPVFQHVILSKKKKTLCSDNQSLFFCVTYLRNKEITNLFTL